jgi:autotransporter translocation and assembly factor TamB
MTHLDRLDVDVDAAPEPGFLRPAIEAALHGRGLAHGPESTIALAVTAAVLQSARSAATATSGGPGLAHTHDSHSHPGSTS